MMKNFPAPAFKIPKASARPRHGAGLPSLPDDPSWAKILWRLDLAERSERHERKVACSQGRHPHGAAIGHPFLSLPARSLARLSEEAAASLHPLTSWNLIADESFCFCERATSPCFLGAHENKEKNHDERPTESIAGCTCGSRLSE